MASAIVGGLLSNGLLPEQIFVIDPHTETRERHEKLGIKTIASANSLLKGADIVIWAVKPQVFKQAAVDTKQFLGDALHLSVAAGIGSESIANWLDSQLIVRAMPNTPALIGLGQTGLYAREQVSADQRLLIESVVHSIGELVWVKNETLLDAVTALSGSGPAYVFYFIESMIRAGVNMGLHEAQAKQLAIGTFLGATELARTSQDAPAELREKVTSKGGTTYAALTMLENNQVGFLFEQAMEAARSRAIELGKDFGC